MAKKTPKELKAEATELSDLITRMRKKQHNFALTLGKDGGVVLAADPKKAASVMWRQAKANGGTSKGCMGVASVTGKLIQFTPEGGEEPPKALLLNTKKHLKDLGLAYKVIFVLPGGAVGDDDSEDEAAQPKPQAVPPVDDAPEIAPNDEEHDDPRIADLQQQIEDLTPKVAALAQTGHVAADKLQSGLVAATAALGSGKVDQAQAVVSKVARAIDQIDNAQQHATNTAPTDTDADQRKALETAFGPIAENLDRLKAEASDKVAQKAEQIATMFWQVLDAGEWQKATNSIKTAQSFVDKELAVLAAYPAPNGEMTAEQTHAAELLTLRADDPQQAEQLMHEDLTVRDPRAVFDPDHMIELSQKEFEYAGNATLRELMTKIEAGLKPDERDTVITQLAEIVGANKDKLDADYDRYRVLLEQQKAFGQKKDKETVPGLEDDTFPDFRASQEQLLFGAVLGEVFGIHEVFASLLSSTGGLVGPGNDLVPGVVDALHLTDRDPVGLHGIFHDAAGYLTSYHDDGPGYNYLESEDEFLDTGNPLCGQVSGIEFWVKQIQSEDAQAADEFAQGIAQRADAQVLLMEQQLEGAREQTADAIDDYLAEYEALKKQAGGWTGWLPSGMTDPAELLSDAAVYGAAGATEFAVDASTRVAEAGAHVGAAASKVQAELSQYDTELEGTAKDIGFAALGGVIDTGEVLADTAAGTYEALSDGAAGVANAVTEASDDIGNHMAQAGNDISATMARTSQRLGTSSGVLEAADALADAAGDMTAAVTSAALSATGEIAEAVGDIGANVLDTGLDLVKETADLGMGLGQTVAKTTGELADIAVDAAGDAFEAVVDIGDAVGDALGGVADAAGGLVDDIVDNPLTEAVANKLSSWASSFGW